MKAIIFDIDGTLADLTHRLHHIKSTPPNWDKFFEECPNDKLIEPIAALAASLYANEYVILLVSGRSDIVRKATTDWMDKHHIHYDTLYMRKHGDYRPDTIVKSEILDEILAKGYQIEFVVDDRNCVVDMWRSRGITCLQCREWTEDMPPTKKGKLTLMIGPSGAGKTTWLAKNHRKSEIYSPYPISSIISSDDLRGEMCGDFRDQSKNDAVFAALHAIVKTRLEHGLDTVIDATNLKRKDRLANITLAKGGEVEYIVIDRPMEEKRGTAGWRAELPIDLLLKHQNTFNSQIKDILKGDNLPNVTVRDMRVK